MLLFLGDELAIPFSVILVPLTTIFLVAAYRVYRSQNPNPFAFGVLALIAGFFLLLSLMFVPLAIGAIYYYHLKY